jgi:protein TonB
MAFSFDWSNAISPERRDLVFENRNKEYGGYILRRDYSKRTVVALVIALLAIGVAVTAPMIASWISKMDLTKEKKVTDVISLEEPPPIDKTAPPPPPVEPPPPVQKLLKFTVPIVTTKEDVEEPPPTQEETKETQVSTISQEGENLPDLPPEPSVDPDEGKVFTVVEEMPTFPGGEEELFKYLQKGIKYPAIARENNITGRVYVTFVVDKDGKIRDAKVLRGIGGGCDEEALRVVRSMPDWKPGRQNGRNVQVQYNLPVNFNLK